MKQFSFQRFAQLLRLDIRLNRYLPAMLGIFLGYFFGFVGIYWKLVNPPDISLEVLEDVLAFSASRYCLVLTVFYVLVASSMMFTNLSTKDSRLKFFMLPASNLEKMASRFVVVLLFGVAWPLVAYFLADLLRVGVLAVLGVSSDFSFSAVGEMCRQGWQVFAAYCSDGCQGNLSSLYSGLDIVFGLLIVCLCQVAGGLIFRRRAFVFTNVLLFFVLFTLSWVASSVDFVTVWLNCHADAFELFATVFLGLLTLFLLSLIPWLFCHKQVQ